MDEKEAMTRINRAEEAIAAGRNRPTQGVDGGVTGEARRQPGRSVLLDRARQLRREAQALEALASAIPDNFPSDADEALWNLAIKR